MILCHDRIPIQAACKNFKNVLKPDFHESTLLGVLTMKESCNYVMTQTNDDDLLL